MSLYRILANAASRATIAGRGTLQEALTFATKHVGGRWVVRQGDAIVAEAEGEPEPFNVWTPTCTVKTIVLAHTAGTALDLFCQMHGYHDHAAYLAEQRRRETDLRVEPAWG